MSTGSSGSGKYEAVVSGQNAAGNYGTYDPYGLFGQGGAGAQALSSMLDTSGPGAYMSQFMRNAGPLAGLVSGSMSPLEQALTARASRLSEAAGRQMAGSFAPQGYGALRSGAAAGAVGRAMAEPFADVAGRLGEQQLGLTGNLWNNAMGIGAQQQANALAAALGTTTTVAPQYEYQPTGFEQFMSYASPILGAFAGGLGGSLGGGGNPLGAIQGAISGLQQPMFSGPPAYYNPRNPYGIAGWGGR